MEAGPPKAFSPKLSSEKSEADLGGLLITDVELEYWLAWKTQLSSAWLHGIAAWRELLYLVNSGRTEQKILQPTVLPSRSLNAFQIWEHRMQVAEEPQVL